jgi:hypothetical protein
LRPWLRPLNPHLGLVCHIEPLSEKELGPFVEDYLRASHFPASRIAPHTISQIFRFTQGNPKVASELTLRAVQLAEASSARALDEEIIADAARDTGLSDTWRSRKSDDARNDLSAGEDSLDFERTDDENGRDFSLDEFPMTPRRESFSARRESREDPFAFETSQAATSDMLMQTFLHDRPADRRRWFGAKRLLLPLLLLVIVAAWLQRDFLTQQVDRWIAIVQAPAPEATSPPFETLPLEPPLVPPETARAPAPPPPPPPPAASANNGATKTPPPRESERLAERPQPTPANRAQEERAERAKAAPPPPQPEEQGSRPEAPEMRNKQIEAQVQRAIQLRAISGVEVTVIDGTAVLEGRVASERQKQAAERAAGGVDGVQRVRSRIVVG